jgi:hypothetical protein
MADYVNREDILSELHNAGGCDAPPDTWADGYDKAIDLAYSIVEKTPSADVAPVQHGQWIEDDYGYSRCSACGWEWDDREFVTPYCPNCGAKMDQE